MGGGEGSASGSSPGVKPGVLTALLEELAVAPEAQREKSWEPALRSGEMVGRFELLRELGRGSFGVVWEARDRELGRKVAFKLVRAGRGEAGADQLHREAEAVARLQHPNLVTLHDVGRCEHGPYLVLELLRGETLQARLARGPLPLAEALAVAVGVARGLAHAHAEGVVHRDLKPSNVFLCERGGVKLLDFGMAHAFGRKRVSGGTPAYMAPEQWRDAPEDERTDVFALGVMLYQMLTGALPFPDDGGRSVRKREPAPGLQISDAPALGPLAARMLAKDAAERTRDGGAALAELERIAAELPPDGPVAAAPVVIRHLRRRRGRVAAAIAAAAAIALGVGALILVRRPPAPAGPPSVAVLPFADMSPGKDQEYFADGISEEILDTLARVPGLKVIGRTSSFSFKGKSEDLRAIGQKLGAGQLLEGSVRKAGTRVRITAQLIETAGGSNVWSETFDRELTDVFALQEEIARAVASALRASLLPATAVRAANPEAYNQYLLGLQFARQGTKDGTRRAFEAFRKAVQLDPAFTQAQARVAEATRELYEILEPASLEEVLELQRRALAEAERAVAMGPDLPDGYRIRGSIRQAGFDWEGARADLEKARELGPEDAPFLTFESDVLSTAGQLSQAIGRLEHAVELEPLSPDAWRELGRLRLMAGQTEAARAAFQRALEIAPDSAWSGFWAIAAELLAGNADAALASFRRHAQVDMWLVGSALCLDRLGRQAEADRALAEIIRDHAHSYAYQVAEIYAARGDRDAAFEWLERAHRQLDGGITWVKIDPFLAPLHGDPRYTAFLRKMNLPVD